MVEGFRILPEGALDQGRVAQADSNEDVEPRAASEQQSRHVRRLAHEILSGRRLVIDVTGIDVSAAVDQVLRDVDRRGPVQRRFPVAAPRVHERRIAFDQLLETIEPAVVRGGKHVDHRPARHEGVHLRRRPLALEDAEASRPPLALEIDVRAVLEEQIDHRQVFPGHVHRPTTEIAGRFVHRLSDLGVFLQEIARPRDVSAADRRKERLLRRSRQRFNFPLQIRPALEAVAAGDDQLRVGQFERVGIRRFGVQRANSRERVCLARPGVAKQIFRALLLHLEIRFGRERFDENGRTFFRRHDDTSRQGCARCPRRRAGGSSGT